MVTKVKELLLGGFQAATPVARLWLSTTAFFVSSEVFETDLSPRLLNPIFGITQQLAGQLATLSFAQFPSAVHLESENSELGRHYLSNLVNTMVI